MKLRFLHKFITDDSGAVTVDWVVLTAALVSLGLAVFMAIDDQVLATASGISDGVTASAAFEADFGGGADAGELIEGEEDPEG